MLLLERDRGTHDSVRGQSCLQFWAKESCQLRKWQSGEAVGTEQNGVTCLGYLWWPFRVVKIDLTGGCPAHYWLTVIYHHGAYSKHKSVSLTDINEDAPERVWSLSTQPAERDVVQNNYVKYSISYTRCIQKQPAQRSNTVTEAACYRTH